MPTPADLARVPRRPLTARTVAPAPEAPAPAAPPVPDATFRQAWEQRIRVSTLRPYTRLVALVLASYADGSGQLADRLSVPRLARASGLPHELARIQLHRLHNAGWTQLATNTPDVAAVVRLRVPRLPTTRA